jgi:hypothetical protein
MTCRTNPANSSTHQGCADLRTRLVHARSASSPSGKDLAPSPQSLLFYSLFPTPCLTVIQITVSTNSPLYGV